jgi:hypothetical protein
MQSHVNTEHEVKAWRYVFAFFEVGFRYFFFFEGLNLLHRLQENPDNSTNN